MRVDRATLRAAAAMRAEDGVSMVIALMVMLVTSLLLVATFTAANGETHLSHTDLTQKQAYYAALAGVQEYEYKLEDNPDYWETCPALNKEVPGETTESYAVTTLAAHSDPEGSTCNAANPFKTIIESSGSLTNTFRIESVGKAGSSSRALIATFQVANFLDYVYFTQYEVQDPDAYKGGEAGCGNYAPRREELKKKHELNECNTIEFAPEDSVHGPMKTDDKAEICDGTEFGRSGHNPPDSVEIDLGVKELGSCGGSSTPPKYNTESGKEFGKFTENEPELKPPESDDSLKTYVESANEFSGLTELELEGATNEIKVTQGGGSKKIQWPNNGLIYVQSKGSCGYNEFEQAATDTSTTRAKETNCGSVYVKGKSSATKSLTIAAEEDLIIDGDIEPYGVTPPAAPPGTTTVGLIATRFVRIYHPCSGGQNQGGTEMKNPWIYAAILSTSHSFLVDNQKCGAKLEDLNVYGAIGQKFRGIVGQAGGSGYTKDYIYDERLATDEPPYFLAPLKAGWHIARLTAPSPG